jgi:hypothetical protein
LLQRALVAEGPDRAVDQARVLGQHHVRADAHLADDAGAQVLDQDVGALRTSVFSLATSSASLMSMHDRLLVAVGGVEEQRVAVDERRAPEAGIVAAVGLLHLDHLGAHVGQDHPGQRTGQRLAHFDDANSLER